MNNFEKGFGYTMTFSQYVHGVHDEKMEAIYQKSIRNDSFWEDTEDTFIKKGGSHYVRKYKQN